MSHQATINFEDGNIRFWAHERLPKDEYNKVREMGLRWKRGEQCFIGSWSPRLVDFLAEKYGIEELEEDGTDLMERAESRAEYYAGYSDNAKKRSDERYEASSAAVHGIPLGQPILVGHHSERRHRNAIERSHRNMRKSIDERERAEYWARRADSAVRAQARKQTPGAISRRIDKLEADLRKMQRAADRDWFISRGLEEWAIDEGKDPDEVWQKQLRHATRWVEFLEARIAFQKALYEASGGVPADSMEFEVGDYVNSWHGWCKIIRINKKSLTVDSKWGNGRIKYAEVKEHRKA